jgi:two-component system, NarL family, response regulator NreC
MQLKVLLADDHKLLREGLRSLLLEQSDMTVVGEAEDGKTAVRLAAKTSPDVVVMDISMPGLNGIDAARQILSARRETRIIALSMHLNVRMVLEMFRSGATGYLLKDCAFEEVVQAVQAAAAREWYLSPRIADVLLAECARRVPRDELASLPGLQEREREALALACGGKDAKETASILQMTVKKAESLRRMLVLDHVLPRLLKTRDEESKVVAVSLTAREKEILGWVREGKSTGDISAVLTISQDTVKYHLKNIFHKLNATSRSQAVAIAIENKLIDS